MAIKTIIVTKTKKCAENNLSCSKINSNSQKVKCTNKEKKYLKCTQYDNAGVK